MAQPIRRSRPARTAAAALSSVALLATLGACGGAASGESADALTDVQLAFNGALTVCTDSPYAPFVYEEKGKLVGFDVDLGKEIAEALKVDLDVLDVAFDDITSGDSLNNDVCDVAISAMTITGERARVLDFSSPYFDARQALVVPRGSGLDEISELGGQRVGVQKDTTGETYVSDYAPESTKVTAYDDAAALQAALGAGELDAALLDNTVSGAFVAENPNLKLSREFETGEQYGMAVKKDGNIPLLRTINGTLADLREDGTYDKIYDQYFG
ncbi:ABC transporter substrate-binding protein [Nocardioides sp. S-58]|uniref:ABC transporter substrate-binding protein n=1 Tax=Nocardioides renjunii TaxID=3095075 RepID=A0ABU5K824_9ACTN|nr:MULTISPECIES: ABC transporter substrate-binding protein [unclassified Nocardioides]MDZ5660624.1 ABC transporter substrate-binding protein [Nocardioides sp. S-58]WQQ21622.1 ABC transporter substrate-binding protein [Nocardioides sp. S-34]